jgi:hypothetical protein
MLFPSARNTRSCYVAVLCCTFLLTSGVKAAAQVSAATPPGNTAAASSTSVAIVIDQSKAAKYKTDQLKKAVAEFMQAFTSEDEACVYFAGEKPTLARDFTADSALIEQSLKQLKPTKGKLGLYDSVAMAVDHLRSDATGDSAAVVLFTAGADNASRTVSADLESKLKANPRVALYSVALPGLDMDWQSSLQQLAVASGGRAFFPSKSGQLREASSLAAQGVFGRTAVQVAKSKAADGKPLAPYKSVVVRSVPLVESRSTSAARGGENVLLQHVLVARLQKSKLFSEVVDAGTMESAQVPVAPASEPGTKLELLATVVGVEQGNRLSWRFLAAGGTRMKVQVVLRDAATQQPVLSLVQEGTAVSGLFSGGEEQVQSKAVLRTVNGIIDQIRKAK